jgi:two-component system, NtrC family, nitrogen regulation sensor histidine kinase NtrY
MNGRALPGGEPPRSAYNMTARSVVMIVAGSAVALGAAELVQRAAPDMSRLWAAVLAVLVSLPLLMLLIRKIIHRGLRDSIVAVSDGLLSLTENDYSMRLAVERQDEVGLLVHRFNTLSASLRRDRSELYQREMLPETILAATSMVVILCNQAGQVVYANPAARQFFEREDRLQGNDRLEGYDLSELLAGSTAEVRATLEGQGDVLFTTSRRGSDEPDTYHLAKRYFEFSLQRHTLYILRPLTKEVARKEVETWKKAIRVLSHEVNNSLAPITSLVQTTRLMLDNPAHAHRLRAALDTIEERAGHLQSFLDGYASFARLPLPAKQLIPWPALLAGVEGLYPFQVVGPLPAEPAYVDPGQMQQVLINLFKNATESGSPPEEIAVVFRPAPASAELIELEVLDRGRGMPGEVMNNALLPFYSTKKSGSGLGLALCREIVEAHGGRLSLHRREGGGMAVRCGLRRPPRQLVERSAAARADGRIPGGADS